MYPAYEIILPPALSLSPLSIPSPPRSPVLPVDIRHIPYSLIPFHAISSNAIRSQTVDLSATQLVLKDAGVKCSKKDLFMYLDDRGITHIDRGLEPRGNRRKQQLSIEEDGGCGDGDGDDRMEGGGRGSRVDRRKGSSRVNKRRPSRLSEGGR